MKRFATGSMVLAMAAASTVVLAEDPNPRMLRIGQIEWHLDYDEAMKIARQQKRPLWLHLGEHPG